MGWISATLASGAFASRTLVSRGLDLALPPLCAGCGRDGAVLCLRCLPAFYSRVELPPGIPLGLRAEAPPAIAQLEWCASYAGPVRGALHQLKYGGERRIVEPLSAAMAARWRAAGVGGDFLCPVPVHAERERQRGYDQAVLLAEALARRLAVPCHVALRRVRNTRPQFDLGRRPRLTNVSGAFALRGTESHSRVAGAWVVLVDDVATTGATLGACAAALYDAGAIAVSAITVARER